MKDTKHIENMKEIKDLLTKIDIVFKTEKKKISLIHYLQQDLPNYNIKITNHSNLIGSDYWMLVWINSGNTISDYFLKTRLGFDDDMIKYYLDHKVLYKRIDGNYILNMGGWHGKK